MRTPVVSRKNSAALPWLRAIAFAAVTYLALNALGFFPAAVAPVIGVVVGALGLFAPGVGVLLFLVATGLPMLAGSIVAGALYLVLGFGIVSYLSDAHGRAFLYIALAFAATLLKAEWAVVALAGLLLGASDGAVVAAVACLLIEATGLLLGLRSIGTLATGGTTALVDLRALAQISDPLGFGWFMPALAKVDPSGFLKVLTGARDVAMLGAQPLLWAAGAAVAGILRKPIGDPRRRLWSLFAVGASIIGVAVVSIGASAALGGPVAPARLAVAAVAALGVGLAFAFLSESLFTPELVQPAPRGTSAAEEADVDELLRMISTAEEELASKHTVHKTVLITDMKAFSRMTQELGSTETAKLVQRHRDLLLPVIEKAGGHGKSTGGDGLLAAFDTPAAALAAAADMQAALESYNASRPGEESVLIRAGVASGEVVLDKGGKPFLGDALNLAARVMSLADGGQIFTTGGDAEAAAPLPYGSVRHGDFRLKNIAAEVPIVEVLWRNGQEGHAPQSTETP